MKSKKGTGPQWSVLFGILVFGLLAFGAFNAFGKGADSANEGFDALTCKQKIDIDHDGLPNSVENSMKARCPCDDEETTPLAYAVDKRLFDGNAYEGEKGYQLFTAERTRITYEEVELIEEIFDVRSKGETNQDFQIYNDLVGELQNINDLYRDDPKITDFCITADYTSPGKHGCTFAIFKKDFITPSGKESRVCETEPITCKEKYSIACEELIAEEELDKFEKSLT